MTREQGSQGWIELAVQADNEAVEAVAEVFSRYSYGGGVAIEEPFDQEKDGENLRVATDRPFVVRAYIPADEGAREKVEAVERALWHLSQMRYVGPLATASRAEEDWANAWKEHYHVHRVGRRTVIRPPWREYVRQPDDIVIELDPGMAFGTGLHPSTQLCLVALEGRMAPGMRVLDVGVGSGVLTIAAARLGAASVDALDVEPVAVRSARENAARNDLATPVRVAVGTVEETPEFAGRYDLVVANIIARIIIELAPALVGACRPGGRLITSGVIIDRADETRAALAVAGLVGIEQHQMGDWTCIEGMRDNG
ncbi:MAG: Ribosomal protein L11 methyltransferase [uncultured Thermomicrobiales bacterium]|uniref:Ribosomal protein L11 methyltransferase n=1 Tax=uncultured Thermomicrobiales bacterium TaxID=1645740 RepID=A0A6J4VQP7_9BACT|nr:MAG: Ribosomal protein L11 methyltransferase [uncultured Thermomicrobiales bacterium]